MSSNKIGRNIKELRSRLNLNQDDLAKKQILNIQLLQKSKVGL